MKFMKLTFNFLAWVLFARVCESRSYYRQSGGFGGINVPSNNPQVTPPPLIDTSKMLHPEISIRGSGGNSDDDESEESPEKPHFRSFSQKRRSSPVKSPAPVWEVANNAPEFPPAVIHQYLHKTNSVKKHHWSPIIMPMPMPMLIPMPMPMYFRPPNFSSSHHFSLRYPHWTR